MAPPHGSTEVNPSLQSVNEGTPSRDTGEKRKFPKHYVLIQGRRVWVPTWTLSDFCGVYRLSNATRTLLDDQGFETTAALLGTTDACLLDADFKRGQIAEIKRALKEFIFHYGVSDATAK
ncbi:hypothetical protein B0H17DRAFT_1333752 [Mycena rosella]|uniref:Uncharacterized protein n=1 Tax=Mycena rosella TaxID=1033263 RepID=A0AAD7GED6_MYCRO|nr:hypothetical protein B0H17DRAFT_1333752 [Mycena rosella]